MSKGNRRKAAPAVLSLAACCLALGLVACGGGAPPATPDLPLDGWQRDPEPILAAGARGEEGQIENAVADPDVIYDEATGVVAGQL